MSVKEQVPEAIQRLPDNINYWDFAGETALLSALNDAESDIKDGRLVSNEEMRARLEKWGAK